MGTLVLTCQLRLRCPEEVSGAEVSCESDRHSLW